MGTPMEKPKEKYLKVVDAGICGNSALILQIPASITTPITAKGVREYFRDSALIGTKIAATRALLGLRENAEIFQLITAYGNEQGAGINSGIVGDKAFSRKTFQLGRLKYYT